MIKSNKILVWFSIFSILYILKAYILSDSYFEAITKYRIINTYKKYFTQNDPIVAAINSISISFNDNRTIKLSTIKLPNNISWDKIYIFPETLGYGEFGDDILHRKDFGQGVAFVYTYHNVPVFQEYQNIIFYDQIEQSVDFIINTNKEDIYYQCDKNASLIVSSDRIVMPINCISKSGYENIVNSLYILSR